MLLYNTMGQIKNVMNLNIDIEVWNRFKKLVDRDTSLNDAVVMLIHKFVNDGNKILDSSKLK